MLLFEHAIPIPTPTDPDRRIKEEADNVPQSKLSPNTKVVYALNSISNSSVDCRSRLRLPGLTAIPTRQGALVDTSTTETCMFGKNQVLEQIHARFIQVNDMYFSINAGDGMLPACLPAGTNSLTLLERCIVTKKGPLMILLHYFEPMDS